MIKNIFGLQGAALKLSEQRAELLSSNLANSSTPSYKARDIDFKAALERVQRDTRAGNFVKTTNSRHLSEQQNGRLIDIGYRPATQASQDGNTVDSNVEAVAFMENAIRYQANLTFVRGKYKQLLTAIKGE